MPPRVQVPPLQPYISPAHLRYLCGQNDPKRQRRRHEMAATTSAQSTTKSSSPDNDIYSISDTVLAQRYHFIREIGAGNWGCVWLCKPRPSEQNARTQPKRVAVKLVFREKKETTAQRVRSLWNEMKIVRSLKHDAHPSIIPFHSFIITPSFAIITMEYLPQLVPVEVPEVKAREWFRSLLSAVVFLHSRGIVHNDIKPANILLSTKGIPVLVDFGFAERYDIRSKRAFLSNLAYGTPEYLSPERARGHVHDTRKSDVWSLGITFFEILVGRTPFEYIEGEKFVTPEDLEVYWTRTLKGEWIGKWNMSTDIEVLLHKLINPSIEHRISAKEAMKDPYWNDVPILKPVPSIEKMSTPKVHRDEPTVRSASKKQTGASRPALGDITFTPPPSKAEAKVPMSAKKPNGRDMRMNVFTPHRQRLPTIEASPIKPSSLQLKENSPHPTPTKGKSPLRSSGQSRNISRRVLDHKAIRDKENAITSPREPGSSRMAHDTGDKARRRKALVGQADSPRSSPRKHRQPVTPRKERIQQAIARTRPSDSSRVRLDAFQQLKALARERIIDTSSDDETKDDSDSSSSDDDDEKETESKLERNIEEHQDTAHSHLSAFIKFAKVESTISSAEDVGLVEVMKSAGAGRLRGHFINHSVDIAMERSEGNPLHDTFPRYGYDTERSLTRSLKASLDKTLRLCSSTTLNRASKVIMDTRRTSHRELRDVKWEPANASRRGSRVEVPKVTANRASLAGSSLFNHDPPSMLDKHDRMTTWIQNVEQVVKEAQENFASSSVTPIPPLRARPATRPSGVRPRKVSYRNRNILPADQIFQRNIGGRPSTSTVTNSDPATADNSLLSNESTVITVPEETGPTVEPTSPSSKIESLPSPQKRRRATVSTPPRKVESDDIDISPPSSPRRREKSKSAANLIGMSRAISPLAELQKQLDKDDETPPVQPLSAVLDKSIFIARSGSTPPLQCIEPVSVPNVSVSLDLQRPTPRSSIVLLSSQTQPLNRGNPPATGTLDTPVRRNVEVSYDRLLMSTSGVKRVGKGYQSSFNTIQAQSKPTHGRKHSKLFGGGLRMPPPVSSDDVKYCTDEFGNIAPTYHATEASWSSSHKDDGVSAVRIVREALRAIVNVKTHSRKQTRHA